MRISVSNLFVDPSQSMEQIILFGHFDYFKLLCLKGAYLFLDTATVRRLGCPVWIGMPRLEDRAIFFRNKFPELSKVYLRVWIICIFAWNSKIDK